MFATITILCFSATKLLSCSFQITELGFFYFFSRYVSYDCYHNLRTQSKALLLKYLSINSITKLVFLLGLSVSMDMFVFYQQTIAPHASQVQDGWTVLK